VGTASGNLKLVHMSREQSNRIYKSGSIFNSSISTGEAPILILKARSSLHRTRTEERLFEKKSRGGQSCEAAFEARIVAYPHLISQNGYRR
jgi:hypothetical protein